MLLLPVCRAAAQNPVRVSIQSESKGDDVLVPISKYIARGDADALSVWFADNLDMTIFSQGGNSSRAQARQILKAFFDNYTPRSFSILHTADKGNQKYALAKLHAGGETFNVTIFLNCRKGSYCIQQLSVDRMQ